MCVKLLRTVQPPEALHHPITFYFSTVALFCLWAWAVIDSIHTLRHRANKSFRSLFWAKWTLIGCAMLILILIFLAFASLVKGGL
jgi:hypothetical protein